MSIVPKLCSIDGCEDKAKAKGWCRKHWGRWVRNGDPNKLERYPDRTCSIEGCARTHYALGFCKMHHERVRRTGSVIREKTHGRSGKPEYHSWDSMIQRCCNPNNNNYPEYGASGILVCERYRESFAAFYEDMGSRPDGTSIDRVNGQGNYSCGKCDECKTNGWVFNLRWATRLQQILNREIPTGISGYHGVEIKHRIGRDVCIARIASNLLDPRCVYLGIFSTPEEAANMYDAFAIQLFETDARLNFEYLSVPIQ